MDFKLDPLYLSLPQDQQSVVRMAVTIKNAYRHPAYSSVAHIIRQYNHMKKNIANLGKGSAQEDDFYIIDAVANGYRLCL